MCLSVASIAKARSCLDNPSIITSKYYLTIYHLPLWSLCLSFKTLEPRLRSPRISQGDQLLPERVLKKNVNDVQIKTKMIIKTDNKNSRKLLYLTKILSSYKRVHTMRLNNYMSIKTLTRFRYNSNMIGLQLTVRKKEDWRRNLIIRCGDVERNPGPLEITLVTLNCRGLKNDQKFKQLINRCHSEWSGRGNAIIALQETHIESNYLNYTWKGKHIFTKGTGSKGGVITLLSDNVVVREQVDLDEEAHVSLIEIMHKNEKLQIIAVNLHSPCAHNKVKIEFFKKIREEIDKLQNKYNEAKVIIMGDYNTTFDDAERLGTSRSRAEEIISKKVTQIFESLDLRDCWDNSNHNTMTWRHGVKMSRLDRIQWSESLCSGTTKVNTDWTLTQSDHSAVIVKLSSGSKTSYDKVVRIDTFFMNNVLLKHQFLKEVGERMEQIKETKMNPHQKLEFLKMCIRSIAIEIATNHKKKRDKELKDLRNDINFWQVAFESAQEDSYKSRAMEKLDEATCKRDKYLDELGEFISNRVKSKWYQEGERGTKYFLNLQNSKGRRVCLSSLTTNSGLTNDPKEIDMMVEDFYRNLYEKGDISKQNKHKLTNFLGHMKEIEGLNIDMINTALTESDLQATLRTCKDSSPGPDGIPYSLIKFTWQYFGPLLISSWQFAQETGQLSASHESSYLKLLPKEGKDLTQLKNWRPITLSNCDFKIITKTLANRLTLGLRDIISTNQTAYIKGRQITDNLHLLQYAVEKSASLEIPSLIASLDAEKAFDSVEHWYIREVLKKIGLSKFVDTFDLIYRNQIVTIHLNNRIAGNYLIKNGVKQGDALSCILFILSIEPLIKNINNDDSISNIKIHGCVIPKTIAYADDVACIIEPGESNLQKIFDHYQNMYEVAGLKLNADKTEIITNRGNALEYEVTYNNNVVRLSPCNDMKVNGLIIGFQTETVRKKNFNKVFTSMENQLRMWTNRNLSLLGKIQIFKTFGLSQILFVCATMELTRGEEKQLNNLIYKFIWSKNIDGNKAPDRIKRAILHKNIEHLGFGMLDYKEVIKSIRIKTVMRLINDTTHPFNKIIIDSLSSSVINITCLRKIRPPIDSTIEIINGIWKEAILTWPIDNLHEISDMILNEYVGNIIIPKYKNQRMAIKHRNDKLGEIISLEGSGPLLKKLDKVIYSRLEDIKQHTNHWVHSATIRDMMPIEYRLKKINKLSSKQLRLSLIKDAPIIPKMIISPDPDTLAELGRVIKKLTNVKLKGIILRAIHGDIYSGTRLKKFGMTDTDNCPRCSLPETIQHQLFECSYVKKLWDISTKITSIDNVSLNDILGHNRLHDKLTITIHSEIIRNLLAIERPTTNQISIVKSVVNRLSIVEKGITKFQITKMKDILNNIT